MQILPDVFTDRAEDVLTAAHSAMPTDGVFDHVLRKSLEEARQGKTDQPHPDSAEAEDDAAYLNALMADAPYNPTPEVFSPFTPQTVRLTAQEADALAEAMRADGVSSKALAAVRDAGRMPGGPTMDILLRAAREALEGASGKLSRDEEAQLLSLSQKVAGEQGKDVKNLFASGTPKDALDALMTKLADNPGPIAVTPEEMAALSKALGLSEGTAQTLLQAFGDKPTLSLTGNELNTLLAPARGEVDLAAADMDKLLTSLEKHLTPILKDAAKREEMERMAGMRESRAVAQVRTLIEDTATQAAPGREDVPDQSKQTRAVARRNARAEKEAASSPAENGTARAADTGTANHAANAAQATPSDAHRPEKDAEPGDARARDNKDFRDQAGHSERSDQRASTQRASTASAHASSSSGLYAAVSQGVGTVTPQNSMTAANPAETSAPGSALSAQTLDQIEQAVLTAHKNGAQRLEVALTPDNLGTITVVLTTRHGEVSALIQPEKAETAALITQQTEQIKAQLENQGFKVEKVDVQTQLTDQQGQNWQGADQHNASRDLAARAAEMERLRRLGRGIGSSQGDVAATLAHDMHLQARPAMVAGQGLHLIA